MKIKLILIIILILFLTKFVNLYAFSPKDDYLWIEFAECIKEKDGSLTLPLKINYGSFPYKKKEVLEFDSLRAFYTLAKEDDEGSWLFYETEIERGKGKNIVKIKSFTADRFIVFVEAKKTWGEATHCYFAKTSFTLFGHSSSKRKQIKPIALTEINRQLEIFTTPQFHYWPQTGNPIKIIPLFNKDYLPLKVMYLFDENMPSIDIMTDEKGSYTYVPPEDKKLNWKGETAFKQAVIVTEETKGDIRYISSYTLLLHRSRFKNCKLLAGAVIFLGTMLSVFLFVIIKRKRFKF